MERNRMGADVANRKCVDGRLLTFASLYPEWASWIRLLFVWKSPMIPVGRKTRRKLSLSAGAFLLP